MSRFVLPAPGPVVRFVRAFAVACALNACTLTSHPVQPADLGTPRSSDALVAALDEPGTIALETVSSAHWSLDKKGLINLEHPKAKAAGIEEGPESVELFFHVLRHPTRGLFVVDTGVERALRDNPSRAAITGTAANAFGVDKLDIHRPLGEYLSTAGQPLAGVLLTHLHPDHLTGMRDVPENAVIYAGPGEAKQRTLQNAIVRDVMDRFFEGKAPVQELRFEADPAGRFAGVIDVFGDGMLWALATPGHSRGGVAYLARTTEGPVLMTGDVSPTAWGWLNQVEPGSFVSDRDKSIESLQSLTQLVREHPNVVVRLGHQAMP